MIDQYTFLAKQPILSAEQEIMAFELYFRDAEIEDAEDYDSLLQATSRVLFNLLSTFGVDKMVKNKQAFINVDRKILDSSIIEGLDPKRFVFEISGYEKAIDPDFTARLHVLHSKGFHFAIDKFVISEKMLEKFRPILDIIEFIKVDLSINDPDVIRFKLKIFKDLPIKLIAEKVEERDDFAFCLKAGFDFFQGHYFKKPELMKGKNVDPERLAIIDMLKFLKSNTDTDLIVKSFEKHPDLSINLLRFINSASIYTRNHISSIRQAVTLIGRSKLTQWLFLMLYAKKDSQLESNPLYITASQRAKLLTLLSNKIFAEMDAQKREEIYFIGMLSVVDALFQMPMQTILQELNIAEEISKIILEYAGEVGKLLRFIIMAEKMDNKDVNPLMAGLNISRSDYLQAVLESFEWNDA